MAPVMTNSIVRGKDENMPDRWLQPREWKQYMRLLYIKNIQSYTPIYYPECGEDLEVDDEQVYCPQCGLVCMDSICYVAGFKYDLPYGLKLG